MKTSEVTRERQVRRPAYDDEVLVKARDPISRNRRFTRFLTTAFPTRRLTGFSILARII